MLRGDQDTYYLVRDEDAIARVEGQRVIIDNGERSESMLDCIARSRRGEGGRGAFSEGNRIERPFATDVHGDGVGEAPRHDCHLIDADVFHRRDPTAHDFAAYVGRRRGGDGDGCHRLYCGGNDVL